MNKRKNKRLKVSKIKERKSYKEVEIKSRNEGRKIGVEDNECENIENGKVVKHFNNKS